MNAIIKPLAIAGIFLMPYVTVQAQFLKNLGKSINNAAQNAATRKAEQKTDNAVSKSIDKATDPNTYKDKGSANNSNNQSQSNVQNKNTADSTSPAVANTTATPVTPKLESYSQYDFVPGDQILFYEDFSQDAIGDFPALWSTSTSGEVKTLNNFPGKWLQITNSSGVVTYLNSLKLPANFIVEFDYIPFHENGNINWYASGNMKLYSPQEGQNKEVDGALYPGTMGLRLYFQNYRWDMDGYNSEAEHSGGFTKLNITSEKNCIVSEQVNHIIVWVQGRRVRVYHRGAKVMDAPTVLAPNTGFTRLVFTNDQEDNRPFFSNIKITTAAPDTRSKLLTEGKLISYGIYFDVNKDVVKPESYGALKDIAQVLQENPTVRIKIVGHTDNDGDDALNLDLSKRRSSSVKNELVKIFGIDASRLESDGLGETKPVAPNDTPANKAKNRRVEFIKL